MLASVQTVHYPLYDELPAELVFLDDVVGIVNCVHAPIPTRARNGKTEFTRAMASNYVKARLTDPAVGKKYSREHIARILFASTIKLSYPTEDVLALAHELFDGQDCRLVHDRIASQFNSLFRELPHLPAPDCPDRLSLVCYAVVYKIASLA